MKSIVYLGSLVSMAQKLSTLADYRLIAWLVEKEDFENPDFRLAAQQSGIVFCVVSDKNSLEKELRALEKIDLGVIANFGIILSPGILGLAKNGFVNIHLGLLPEYPGRNPIAAALRNSEKVTGLTLHWVTGRVDAGPVIARLVTAMPQNPDFASVFHRLEKLAPSFLSEHIKELHVCHV